MKLTIMDAGNTVVPAYPALRPRGYTVRLDERSTDGSEERWTAEDSRCVLNAGDPVTLLGLAALVETRGDGWQASDEELDRFVSEFDYS
jgi:hypothetical protein